MYPENCIVISFIVSEISAAQNGSNKHEKNEQHISIGDGVIKINMNSYEIQTTSILSVKTRLKSV